VSRVKLRAMMTERRSSRAQWTDDAVRCPECRREVDEFTAIAERWGYWSDGCGDPLAVCPECSKREFASDAPASAASPRARGRGASRPDF